jgi:histidyl-tRNA synthetase
VPAVGFGAGDVIARDLMETYGTLPKSDSKDTVCICSIDEGSIPFAMEIAQKLRNEKISVFVDFSGKKIGDKLSSTFKRGMKIAITIGDNEIKSGDLPIKDLETGQEKSVKEAQIISTIQSLLHA